MLASVLNMTEKKNAHNLSIEPLYGDLTYEASTLSTNYFRRNGKIFAGNRDPKCAKLQSQTRFTHALKPLTHTWKLCFDLSWRCLFWYKIYTRLKLVHQSCQSWLSLCMQVLFCGLRFESSCFRAYPEPSSWYSCPSPVYSMTIKWLSCWGTLMFRLCLVSYL